MIEINQPKLRYRQGENENHGIIEVEPLERGYGQTLGTAFRRVLLSSLPGTAVSSVKIDGVLHEFSSIPGIVEDVTAIILNLKKLVVHVDSELESEPVTLRLEVKGPAKVTAADLPANPDIMVIDEDAPICEITGDVTLGMDITFKRGRGYVLADDNESANDSIGTILVDSQFSPVTRVMYEVSEARVGQNINYDKLTLQVWTNGSMQPAEAVEMAAKFLRSQIDLFESLKDEIVEDNEGLPVHGEEIVMVSTQKQEPTQKGNTEILIKDLEFSVRSRNCLKRAGIQTLGELVNKKVSELLEIKNFGKKSLKEVREKLAQFNMQLPDDDGSIDGGNDE